MVVQKFSSLAHSRSVVPDAFSVLLTVELGLVYVISCLLKSLLYVHLQDIHSCFCLMVVHLEAQPCSYTSMFYTVGLCVNKENEHGS